MHVPPADTDGPWFEELELGDTFDSAPALTLTGGHAAVHQAIVGDRLRICLDRPLGERLTGAPGALAHPQLVCDVAIGQSTVATRRVVANLFYRGLQLRRTPRLGDTLHTSTEVVALRQNRTRTGRRRTGMAVLRIRTVDQHSRQVLDFWRCAMLPLSDAAPDTDHADDLDEIPSGLDSNALRSLAASWDLDAIRRVTPSGLGGEHLRAGTTWRVDDGDVVTCAPELARLTLNLAAVHHDVARSGEGRRLVYGGHTIGIAAAHAPRALPRLVYVMAWHDCEHLGPVGEDDTLISELELEHTEPLDGGGVLAHLRSRVAARREAQAVPVLDWRWVGVVA